MMFKVSLLMTALLASAVSALRPKSNIKVNSRAGKKLLANSQPANEKARKLNQEVDFSWVADYSIKFHECHSLLQVGGMEANGEENLLYRQNLVTFSLCPTGTCESKSGHCKDGAQYVTNLYMFVDAYTESKMEAQEYACEQVRERCYCNDDANDDQACENQCYVDAGLDYCVENENEEEFNLQEFLECQEMENQQANNNGDEANYNFNNGGFGQYFVGPQCSADGQSIYLGVFVDSGCSNPVSNSLEIWKTYNYNTPKEFYESIVDHDCVSCLEVDEDNDNNNNNNNNGDVDLIAMCEELYESSGKCERNINSQYADTNGCEYIENILPKLEASTRSATGMGSSGSGKPAKVLAWVFAFTTLGLGIYAFLLWRKLKRSKVNLSEQGDGAHA